MADKPNIDIFNNHLGGISNDEYIGPEGCFYDGENIEIRRNSKEVTLCNYISTYYPTNGVPQASYGSGTAQLTISKLVGDGYINSLNNGLIYKHKSTNPDSSKYENLVYFGNKLFILSDKYIHTIDYIASNVSDGLGIRGINISSDFSTWTGTNWTYGSGSRTHTAGSTVALTDSSATVVASTYYIMKISQTCTTGSCTVSMGGTTFGTLNNTATSFTFFGTASTTAVITITPTSDYNGTISAVNIYPTSGLVEEQWTFNNTISSKPFVKTNLGLYIGDGNLVVKIGYDGTNYAPASGTLTDIALTLPVGEELIGMYELGDQIVMFSKTSQYFRDGYNQTVDRIVPWDQPIVATTQYKTMFYVLTKDLYSILWKTSTGYDRVEVQKEEINASIYPYTRWGNSVTNNNSMIMKDGICYFGGYSKYVNTYGSFHPDFPTSFNKIKVGLGTITSLYGGTEGTVYCGYQSGTTYGVLYIDGKRASTSSSKYPSTPDYNGIIYYNPIIGNDWGTNKALEKYRVSYTLSSSTRIPVYARVDDETDKFTFYASTATSDPVIGDAYTVTTNTFVVERFFKDTSGHYRLSMKRTAGTSIMNDTGTLTRSTTPSTGPSSINWSYYYNIRMIGLVDGSDSEYSSKHRYSFVYGERYNKYQPILGLVTYNTAQTPRVGSFISVSRDIENDL